MRKVYPTVFIALPGAGDEMLKVIMEDSVFTTVDPFKRFIRQVTVSETGDLSYTGTKGDSSVSLGLDGGEGKTATYRKVQQQRDQLLGFFIAVLDDIKGASNLNYATDQGLDPNTDPQLVFLATISEPLLLPLFLTIARNIDQFNQVKTPIFHLLLTYDKPTTGPDDASECKFLKTAFFKEIESINKSDRFISANNYIWLADRVNEMGFNLENTTNLYRSIARFSDLIISDASKVNQLTINHVTEHGRDCIYSTFGISTLVFPVEKIREYMVLHAREKELGHITSTFEIKFMRTRLRDELKRFFREGNWDEIPAHLGKKENGEDIYTPFSFDYNRYIEGEKEFAFYGQISKIEEPKVLPGKQTIGFLKSLETEEDNFKIKVDDFSAELDKAKNRETDALATAIQNKAGDLMDGQDMGINYAMAFTSLLNNNESLVEEYLDAGQHVDYETLSDLQDKIRSQFLGDEIELKEKTQQRERNDLADKNGLIERYQAGIITAQEELKKLEEKVGTDNSKYIELQESNKVREEEIKTLEGETAAHKINIAELAKEIEQIKKNFNRHDYQRTLRENNNQKFDDEFEALKENIDKGDETLAQEYVEKNRIIEKRKKIIFIHLMVVPIALLLAMVLANVIFFYKAPDVYNTLIGVKWGTYITVLVMLVYYIFAFLRFWKVQKELKACLSRINSLLNEKAALYNNAVQMKENKYRYNFNFSKNLLAYQIVEDTIKITVEQVSSIAGFRDSIKTEAEAATAAKAGFEFTDTSFDFCVVQKRELEAIYDKGQKSYIINSDEATALSRYYGTFRTSSSLEGLNQPVLDAVNEIHSKKVQNVSVKQVLFNEAADFSITVTTEAKFKQLVDNSRPLLKTESWPGLRPDVPYIQNLFIGQYDQDYSVHFGTLDIDPDTNGIDKGNEKMMGILSIKSNLPGFLIYDVERNEKHLLQEMKKNERDHYFTDSDHLEFNLMPIEGPGSGPGQDAEVSEYLIADMLIGLIWGKIKHQNNTFTHEVLGNIGFTFEMATGFLATGNAYDLTKEIKEINEEIDAMEEDDLVSCIEKTKQYCSKSGNQVPKKFHKHLKKLYMGFGTDDEGWKELKEILKQQEADFKAAEEAKAKAEEEARIKAEEEAKAKAEEAARIMAEEEAKAAEAETQVSLEEPVPTPEENEKATEEEFNDFVDTGEVSDTRLKKIAEKVKNSEALSKEEQAILTAKTSEIEDIIGQEEDPEPAADEVIAPEEETAQAGDEVTMQTEEDTMPAPPEPAQEAPEEEVMTAPEGTAAQETEEDTAPAGDEVTMGIGEDTVPAAPEAAQENPEEETAPAGDEVTVETEEETPAAEAAQETREEEMITAPEGTAAQETEEDTAPAGDEVTMETEEDTMPAPPEPAQETPEEEVMTPPEGTAAQETEEETAPAGDEVTVETEEDTVPAPPEPAQETPEEEVMTAPEGTAIQETEEAITPADGEVTAETKEVEPTIMDNGNPAELPVQEDTNPDNPEEVSETDNGDADLSQEPVSQDKESQLADLNSLRDANAITQEEYDKLREEL